MPESPRPPPSQTPEARELGTSLALVAQLEQGSELVAVGGFSVDSAAAAAKLRSYRLADPEGYVLLLVEAAHLFASCVEIHFVAKTRGYRVELAGVSLDDAQLRDVLEVTSRSAEGMDDHIQAASLRGRQLLALAMIGATGAKQFEVRLSSSGAESSVSLVGDKLRVGERGNERGGGEAWTRLDIDERALASRTRREAHAHRSALLRSRCSYASKTVRVNGDSINTGFFLPEVDAPYVMRDAQGAVTMLLGRSPARAEATLLLVANGVLIEKLSDQQLDPHFVALVAASDLPRDLGLTKLLRQEAYEQRIEAVRAAARSLPPSPWALAKAVRAPPAMRAQVRETSVRMGALGVVWLLAGFGAIVSGFSPVSVAVLCVLHGAFVLGRGVRRYRRTQQLRKHGRRGVAEVLDTSFLHVLDGPRMIHRVRLSVAVQGARSYEAQVHLELAVDQPVLSKGDRFFVCVDYEDPERIVLA